MSNTVPSPGVVNPFIVLLRLSYARTILQMASLFILSLSLANSLTEINPLRAHPVMVEFRLWLHSDGSFHHRSSPPPHHLRVVSLFPSPKLILIVRVPKFHRPQRSPRYHNDHHLHKVPLPDSPDSYGMKIVVFEYHLLETTLLNYLHTTLPDNINSFIRTLDRWISHLWK